jgi:hypothetical protein
MSLTSYRAAPSRVSDDLAAENKFGAVARASMRRRTTAYFIGIANERALFSRVPDLVRLKGLAATYSPMP